MGCREIEEQALPCGIKVMELIGCRFAGGLKKKHSFEADEIKMISVKGAF